MVRASATIKLIASGGSKAAAVADLKLPLQTAVLLAAVTHMCEWRLLHIYVASRNSSIALALCCHHNLARSFGQHGIHNDLLACVPQRWNFEATNFVGSDVNAAIRKLQICSSVLCWGSRIVG